MQWCWLQDRNWETVYPNLWSKTIHHGPVLYTKVVINSLRCKSNIDLFMSTIPLNIHGIFKPFSQSNALLLCDDVLKVIGPQANYLGGIIHEFSPSSLGTLSFPTIISIFHSLVNSGKPLYPHLLKWVTAKWLKESNSDNGNCTWKNQRCCFVLSLLNEISEHWTQYVNVSHNAWRWELCWLNLATRKMHQQLAPRAELTLNGPLSLNIYRDVGNSQDQVTLPGDLTSRMILASLCM